MQTKVQVASIILNYNSFEDLFLCIEDLKKQKKINQSIIIVDNNSKKECRDNINKKIKVEKILKVKELEIKDYKVIDKKIILKNSNYIIWSKENGGYSQGNNIGLNLAEIISAETALIINPDVRIKDEFYLEKLHKELMKNEEALCAGSSIKDIDGRYQSPLIELRFWDEIMWPLEIIAALIGKKKSYIQKITTDEVIEVEKISGCCLLLKLEKNKKSDYLDNNLFLYCEESVLTSKIQTKKKKIIYIPYLEAYHMHKKTPKKKSLELFIKWCSSRQYYIQNYNNNSMLKKKMMYFSLELRKKFYKLLLKGAK